MIESPGRSGKDQAISLDLSQIGGGGFSRVGETAEWRGQAQEVFKPDALVVRFHVVETPDAPRRKPPICLPLRSATATPASPPRSHQAPESDAAHRAVDGPLACAKTD